MGLAIEDEHRAGAASLAPRRAAAGFRQLEAIARELAPLGAPVVLFNASHSGSRLLARALGGLGLFMGAHRNDSEDSLDVADLVRYLVERHAPDFTRLFEEGDESVAGLVLAAYRSHLEGRPPGQRWGWKLSETGHVLPVISRLFPTARYIHLVRDGRDVAFSPFVAPKAPFWRKIYFGTDRITSWRGMGMTQSAYREHGHRFNAARWVHSVSLGRAHGAMLGERYLEVRYEALVADLPAEVRRIAAFLGIPPPADPGLGLVVDAGSVGKWKTRPAREIAEIKAVLEPTLAAFGYGADQRPAPLAAVARLFTRG